MGSRRDAMEVRLFFSSHLRNPIPEVFGMRKTILLPLAVLAIVTASVAAPRPATQGSSSQDEEAIRKAQDQFAASWNQHDAAAMANLWTEDGDWIGPDGNFMQGRTKIENYLAEAHTGDWATSKNSLKVTGIRFLKPDVAVVNAEYEITGARDWFDKPIPVEKILATSVMVKQDGKWLNAVYRAFVPPPPSED